MAEVFKWIYQKSMTIGENTNLPLLKRSERWILYCNLGTITIRIQEHSYLIDIASGNGGLNDNSWHQSTLIKSSYNVDSVKVIAIDCYRSILKKEIQALDKIV